MTSFQFFILSTQILLFSIFFKYIENKHENEENNNDKWIQNYWDE